MNPQMMQFGNQPEGCVPPGNFTGSYSSSGSGPQPLSGNPPPTGNLGPNRQFMQQPLQPLQQKNSAGPPTSVGFMPQSMQQGTVPPPAPSNGPHGFHSSGPLNGPLGPPSQNLSQFHHSPLGPTSLNGPPHMPLPMGKGNAPPSGPLGSIGPTPSGPLGSVGPLPSGPLGSVGPPPSGPLGSTGPPPSGSLSSVGPPPSGPLGPVGPPSSQAATPFSGPPGPLGPPVSENMSSVSGLASPPGPPVSQGPDHITSGMQGLTVSQGAVMNGPTGNQLSYSSRPPGPLLNNMTSQIGSQSGEPSLGASQLQGAPTISAAQSGMIQSPPQTNINRQYLNGTSQNPLSGPSLQQRPPFNYAAAGQMPVSSSVPNRPAYPPIPSMSQQNPSMPPPRLPSQMPYPQSQQIQSPYSTGNFSKPGYPPPPPQNEMHSNYPPTNQGPYQQMNQQYPGQNYSGMTSPNYPQPQMQQKAQRKLDPDMLPSPIQVMQDDDKNRSGVFYTDQKGLLPPLVTTNFITQDHGNCSPRFLRSTTYNVPVTADLLKQTSVPFALLISPLARTVEGEQPPPIINMGELGPVRCIRCKAYMSPFMQFIDGGKRFHCVFCKATSEVPAEYFQHLDHTGQRVDRYERPELVLGAYEYIATKDYCRNNQPAEPPAIIFVIDVSYNNVKSGLVHLLCSKMKEIIRNLPRDEGFETSNMKVGFITYSNSVHFYNIKSCLAAPQMLLVGDVNEMFMPLLDGFLCDPIESEAVIDLLMQEIPKQFADTRETETILYPAIQAGLEALKASGCAGKLLVFHSSLPIAEAPGKLKNRDDRKVLNTDKEKSVLAPQINSYNNLGQECVQVGCSVDLFIFNNSYVDIATIGEVSRLTGGEIFKYTYFQADIDGDRFIADLKRDISRPVAFDAIMRVRTSTGVRPTEFYGHFFMSNTKDMELASIDCDKAVAVEIKHDDKLTEEDGVYIQVALLYTSCGGQRRLRILNLSLKTCSQMADLYRSCDLDTLVNYFSKQGIFKLLESSPKQIKTNIMNRCANILACYRKNCANPSSTGQLILPECMKLLPLYVNTLLKSDAFSGGSDMTCDDRSFAMHAVMIMDLKVSVVYFYPRLVALHRVDPDSNESPPPIRCTYEKLEDDGVYLLDNGIHMFMWLGLNASTSFVSNVFGVPTAPQVDTDKSYLPALDNSLSLKIRELINETREKRNRSMRLTILKQRDKLEVVFKQYLMEDNGVDGSPSYADFLCHMHSQIRTILS